MLRFSENVNGRTDGAIQCAASTFEIPTDTTCPGVRSSCKAVFEAEPKKITGTSVTGGIGNPKAKALFASPQPKKTAAFTVFQSKIFQPLVSLL